MPTVWIGVRAILVDVDQRVIALAVVRWIHALFDLQQAGLVRDKRVVDYPESIE
jgi:hypothetical protein